mgnify:CR=1 FL=1
MTSSTSIPHEAKMTKFDVKKIRVCELTHDHAPSKQDLQYPQVLYVSCLWMHVSLCMGVCMCNSVLYI